MSNASLHLIPVPLTDQAIHTIPAYLHPIIYNIKVWYVEDLRSARRFLKLINKEIVIDEKTFYLLNEHESESLKHAPDIFAQGIDIGILSESGCPGVADPGSSLVQIAHSLKVKVLPYIGPNSILLALMSSGFNGQHFQFHGYLPNKQPMLSIKIKEIERESLDKNVSQFFIETPYRNDQLIRELLLHCNPETQLSIACNLTAFEEEIHVMKIKEWRKQTISFHKKPAVIGLYAGH